jgi:hypothetical protein
MEFGVVVLGGICLVGLWALYPIMVSANELRAGYEAKGCAHLFKEDWM